MKLDVCSLPRTFRVCIAIALISYAFAVSADEGSDNVGGPVDFRCDSLFIYTKPNRNVCRGNVVIRRDDLLVCCNIFEGIADEAWNWQTFSCMQEVRAQRGIETVWAQRAEFHTNDDNLVLTGRPVLRRGASLLEGDRVTVDIHESHARILRPRGRLGIDPNNLPLTPAIPTGPLPAVCPIAPFKK